ncbi:hypothetical protein DEA98_20505 [Brucella pseudogrignonensis]|nr:hypothetical protein [Brucella pseudogrignonensis]
MILRGGCYKVNGWQWNPVSGPGGRTERNTEAILRAVLELIASSGMQFTYEDVAQLAGVSRRTLHRRWSDRTALIADARHPTTGVSKCLRPAIWQRTYAISLTAFEIFATTRSRLPSMAFRPFRRIRNSHT